MGDNQAIMLRKGGWYLLLLILVVWGAFALRIHALEYQSMWSDEGLSLYRARQPLTAVLNNIITVDGVATKDTNPAFYFLLLHGWLKLAGDSVFALRFLGVALATLAAPLIYGVTTAVFRRSIGVVTAVFFAVSPLHVWNAQILRNYGLLLTLNLLSVYGLVCYLQASNGKHRWLWLGVWAGAGLVGIFTHYFGFFVIAFGGFVLVLHFVWSWWQAGSTRKLNPGRWGWLIFIVLALLLIPLIVTAYDRFQIGQQIDFYNTPPLDFFTHALHAFSAGDILGIVHPWWRVWSVGLLALLGIVFGWRINRGGTLLLLGYQFIPLGLLILLSAITPLYNGTRHLLIGLPPFLIFCGTGLVGGWAAPAPTNRNRRAVFTLLKWLGLGLGIFVLVMQASRVYVQFTAADYIRDDVGGAAEYLNQHAQPEDVIILHDTLIGFTFAYYYDGAAPWHAVPAFGQLDETAVTKQFAALGDVPGRVWFLSYPTPRTGFPREHLLAWADENWTHLTTHSFPSFWLATELRAYLADPVREEMGDGAVVETAVYPHLQLQAIDHEAMLQAGEPWWFTLYWSIDANETSDYHLSLRLLDSDGRLWQQADIPLWNDETSPNLDAPFLRTDHAITFPAGLPSGDYTVTLRVLDDRLQPVPNSEGIIDLPISHVSVSSSQDTTQLPVTMTRQQERWGPLTLHGYDFPGGAIKPGHLVPGRLYWQVKQTPETDLHLRVELLDDVQAPIYEQMQALAGSTQWQVDDVVQTPVDLVVPATAVSGANAIRITLVEPDGQPISKAIVLDTPLTVEAWPLETSLPPIPIPLPATLGDPPLIQLHGLDLPENIFTPDSNLPLTLIWEALAVPTTNYVVFVHLVDEDDNIVAQRDGMPVYGSRPTVSWRADEVLIDQHDLYLEASLALGTYQLYAGLYNPETNERLVPQLNGETHPDGRIPLGTITIEQGAK